jgi:hypothetical protein
MTPDLWLFLWMASGFVPAMWHLLKNNPRVDSAIVGFVCGSVAGPLIWYEAPIHTALREMWQTLRK